MKAPFARKVPAVQAFGAWRSPGGSSPGMMDDILETPEVLQKMLEKHIGSNGSTRFQIPGLERPFPDGHRLAGRSPLQVLKACATTSAGNIGNRFSIIGAGSSFHVAILAEYLVETIARIPVEVQYASEFRYRSPLVQEGDVFVVISNSGETTDAVESLRNVRSSKKGKDAFIMSIVNEDDSTIARESDFVFKLMAGAEAGVAATKAFSASALGCVLMAMALGEACGTLSQAELESLVAKLQELPQQVQTVLDREAKPLRQQEPTGRIDVKECVLWDIGCQNVLAQNFIFLGRGFNFPIALEGAMKCKEISYIHAEGYPAAEMKHGPIALIDQFMPVVFIAPRSDPTYEKIKANIEEVKTRNGAVIVITEDSNNELEGLCEHVIKVPPTHEYLMPLVSVIPLQLLAYMMGVLRGNDVDNPVNLQKIVSSDKFTSEFERNASGEFAPPRRDPKKS